MNSNAVHDQFEHLGPTAHRRELLRMLEARNPLDTRLHHGDGDEALTPGGETMDEYRRRVVLA